MAKQKQPETRSERPEPERPRYSPPRVLLYSEEELLEKLGPARACAWNSSAWNRRSAKSFEFDT